MKRRIIAALLAIALVVSLCFCLTGCGDSSFSVRFIDVGQGDAALVQCDGHYMLIDGGEKSKGDKVCEVLEKEGVKRLDFLVVSHLHEDHFGGLIKVLERGLKVKQVLSNSKESPKKEFREFEQQLDKKGYKITIPEKDSEYSLGSAKIEVIDVCSEQGNDSLVLLVTYDKTKFLFTGDIEEHGQRRIIQEYRNRQSSLADVPCKIDLMKMPHHGADATSLADFMEIFMPDHVVISVGAGNKYGHPDAETMKMLNNRAWKPDVYRTDRNGNIFVESDGKDIRVRTDK